MVLLSKRNQHLSHSVFVVPNSFAFFALTKLVQQDYDWYTLNHHSSQYLRDQGLGEWNRDWDSAIIFSQNGEKFLS